MSVRTFARPSLAELEQRCQKPDHRRLGNMVARRISRPLALRITWLVLPLGVTAHGATLAAWACGTLAAVALAWGGWQGWLLGAALLQVWYLLDHVDGQLARYHGTASLDGVQLDYLMHHTLRLLVPLGAGFGLFTHTTQQAWLLAGLMWGLGTLCLGLMHDARYKAFIQRLKRVHGRLEVIGGGGARPEPATPLPVGVARRTAWLARKLCEEHVVIHAVPLLVLVMWLAGDTALVATQCYLALMALLAPLVAAVTLARSISRQQAEQEFAAWYRPAEGHVLTFRDGWWHIEREPPLCDDVSDMPQHLHQRVSS